MASTAFRDSMSSLGWSRRDPDIPVNTASSNPVLSTLQSLNPFASPGYVSLPTQEGEGLGAPLPAPTRREEEEAFFACESSCHPESMRERKRERRTELIMGVWERACEGAACRHAVICCACAGPHRSTCSDGGCGVVDDWCMMANIKSSVDSEPMGSPPDLRRLQLGRPPMLRHLLQLALLHRAEPAQVRHPVCASPLPFPLRPPLVGARSLRPPCRNGNGIGSGKDTTCRWQMAIG